MPTQLIDPPDLHKQRNVQHIIVQLQIVQGEANSELDFFREQFLELFHTLTGCVGFGFDFKLSNQGLQHKVFGQCTFEFSK